MVKRVLIGILCLVVVAALAGAVVGRVAPSPRVYTADEVEAGVRRNPQAWIGRVLLVRGWDNGWGGQGCAGERLGSALPTSPTACATVWSLLAPSPAGGIPLTVLLPPGHQGLAARNTADAVGVNLRALPLIGTTLFRWAGSRTLRVRVVQWSRPCLDRPPCAGATLIP